MVHRYWYTGMPVSITFQRDKAYEKLLKLIVAGRLPTDQPISERQVAAELGFSRTPVREAMRALSQDGLLEIVPARGTFVRRISDDQMRELYEVREAIEGQSAELAARHGATNRLQLFRAKLEKSRSAVTDREIAKTYEIGANFHVEVCRSAANQILFDLYIPIRNRFKITMRLGRYYDPQWVIDGIDQHLEILTAIEAGKSTLARKTMLRHLQESYQSKRRILDKLSQSDGAAGALESEKAS